jgi:hypothetical protein
MDRADNTAPDTWITKVEKGEETVVKFTNGFVGRSVTKYSMDDGTMIAAAGLPSLTISVRIQRLFSFE